MLGTAPCTVNAAKWIHHRPAFAPQRVLRSRNVMGACRAERGNASHVSLHSNGPNGRAEVRWRCIQFATLTEPEAASMMDDVLATIDVRRRRFTVEEYYRMAE